MHDLTTRTRSGDAELLDGARRRDPEALGGMFDRLGPIVYSALSRAEADADRLDRLVEDVFWEVWVSAGRAGGETDLYRLVLRVLDSRLRGTRQPTRQEQGTRPWA